MLTLYIGTYSQMTSVGSSRGIYCCKLDEVTGALTMQGGADDAFNPSYLALSEGGGLLYAADEVEGRALISVYSIDAFDHQLRFIGRSSHPGGHLCNINLGRDGRYLYGANYTGGNVLCLHIHRDGAAPELVTNCVHEGASANPERQTRPYAHCAMPDRAGRFVVACDLGTDTLYSYAIDASTGALTLAQTAGAPAGEGPRHLVFDRAGQRAFVITELGNSVIRYDYAPDSGTLRQRQILSALPEGSSHRSTGADIHLSPDERHLFASCRDIDLQGNDTIARYRFEGERLVPDGFIRTGQLPRGFALSPDGRLLIVACQQSNALQVFEALSGSLLHELAIPAPVCVVVGG